MNSQEHGQSTETLEFDALVVGAGVAGLYAVYRLRELGLSVRGVETGEGVGGTWYWNRYPGCRCDIPTVEYSYGWDEELQREWSFPETMSTAAAIEDYVNHVADKHDLRKEFKFGTRVTSATFDESSGKWRVETDRGDRYSVNWCVMATGCLSAANYPAIPGLSTFAGQTAHTGQWPKEGLDLTGKRVGVIGTGSSGVQAIPQIAKQAASVTVLQRTPNYMASAEVTPTNPLLEAFVKANYPKLRQMQRETKMGVSGIDATEAGVPPIGEGALVDLTVFADPHVNKQAREEFEARVRAKVTDPIVAEKLIPRDYPFGCKRLIVEIGYLETFNESHVQLVDLRDGAIIEITPNGVRTEQGDFDLDVLVFATGFDALTGPLTRIDITGRGGVQLAKKWEDFPVAYLGLISAGFPNMFMVSGPGGPDILTNVIVSVQHHVEFIADMLTYMRAKNVELVDATTEAEHEWLGEVDAAAAGTQFIDPSCNSFYLGSNVEGKKRRFLPYVGGLNHYIAKCQDVMENDYAGFHFEGVA